MGIECCPCRAEQSVDGHIGVLLGKWPMVIMQMVDFYIEHRTQFASHKTIENIYHQNITKYNNITFAFILSIWWFCVSISFPISTAMDFKLPTMSLTWLKQKKYQIYFNILRQNGTCINTQCILFFKVRIFSTIGFTQQEIQIILPIQIVYIRQKSFRYRSITSCNKVVVKQTTGLRCLHCLFPIVVTSLEQGWWR